MSLHTPDDEPPKDNHSNHSGSRSKAYDAAQLVIGQLFGNGRPDHRKCTKSELRELHGKEKIDPYWSNVTSAIHATLVQLDYHVRFEPGSIEILGEPTERNHRNYHTEGFRVNDNWDGKDRIGECVGTYLNQTDREVFLGPGSSVFHVGRHIEKSVEDRYNTINPAIAAEWASRGPMCNNPPPDQLTVIGGVLDTARFRYPTMRKPDDENRRYSIVVAGADGALVHDKTCALLFRDYSFANITNRFLSMALHSIVICLTSVKMKSENMRTGPHLYLPSRKSVIRKFVVTDAEPEFEIRQKFWQQHEVAILVASGDSSDSEELELSRWPDETIDIHEWRKWGKDLLEIARKRSQG